jgi:predicted XRE-type DNA-binding protein
MKHTTNIRNKSSQLAGIEALEKFKKLVETDLTGLATAWGLIGPFRQNAVVRILLEERMDLILDEQYTWDTVRRSVRSMENYMDVMKDVGQLRSVLDSALSIFQKRVEAKNTLVVTEGMITAYIARLVGIGDIEEGCRILGVQKNRAVRVPNSRLMTCRQFLLRNLSGSDLELLGKLALLRVSGRVEKAQYTKADFIRMCQQVFLEGKRASIIEEGLFLKERQEFRDALALYEDPQDWASVPSHMTRAQLLVFRRFFDSVPGRVDQVVPGTMDALRVVAREIPKVFRYWSRNLDLLRGDKRGMGTKNYAVTAVYRYNSLEEASVFYQQGGNGGSHPENVKGRLEEYMKEYGMARPLDFPAHIGLLKRYGLESSLVAQSGFTMRRSLRLIRAKAGVLAEGLKASMALTGARTKAGLRGELRRRVSTGRIQATTTPIDYQTAALLLPERDYRILVMYTKDCMGQQDIAKALGITQGGVSHRLRSAMDRLSAMSGMSRLPEAAEVAPYVEELVNEHRSRMAGYKKRVVDSTVKSMEALVVSKGSQQVAAETLGITQSSLSNMMNSISGALRSIGDLDPGHKHYTVHKFFTLLKDYPYLFQNMRVKKTWNAPKNAVAPQRGRSRKIPGRP